MNYTPYSCTKLATFETCPRSFRYKYLDHAAPLERPSYLERGIAIHQELALYPQRPPSHLDAFLKTDLGQKYHEVLLGDTKREFKIGLNDDLKLCKYSPSNLLNGIIDLIYMKDGTVYLVDWKTGKVPPQQDWSQLETYAIAFLDRYPVEVSYVYVDACVENTRRYEMHQRPEMAQRLRQRINQVESCTEFERRLTWKCEYCLFRELCQPQTAGLENVVIDIKKD